MKCKKVELFIKRETKLKKKIADGTNALFRNKFKYTTETKK